ncbi:MAG: NUDIX domain-containing protein [Chloroflexota bacterium]|nr:NUDIX domain-containing protein [Chloroflexota bacterium]
MARSSSRVVVVRDGHVALIRREHEGATYYVFTGGGVEEGETFEAAAAREAFEELGCGCAWARSCSSSTRQMGSNATTPRR